MQYLKTLATFQRWVPIKPTCWRPSRLTNCSWVHTNPGPLQSNKMLNLKKPTLKDAFYRRRDNISSDFELIYKAPMIYTVASCKHFATFSLTFTGLAAAYKYFNNMAIVEVNSLEFGLGPIMSEGNEMLGFGIAFILLNITLLVACAKFPLRIYRNKSNYIAMFEGNLPLMAQPLRFAGGEVKETFNGILPWHESMYRMKGRSVLLLTQYFRTPSELNQMLEAPEASKGPNAPNKQILAKNSVKKNSIP